MTPAGIAPRSRPPIAADVAVLTSTQMPGRILVVDDDAAVRRTLITLLEHNGYPARAADSGIVALDLLSRETDIDLVILDVVMPKMTGFETCTRIRKAHGPSLPVIMLTAFGDAQAM